MLGEVVDGAVMVDEPRLAVPTACPVEPALINHHDDGGGLPAGSLDEPVRFPEDLDAPVDVDQLVGTFPHKVDDDIGGGTTVDNATGAIGGNDDEAVGAFEDEGTVLKVGAVAGETGGVVEVGHGGTRDQEGRPWG